jgi:hypothetical protein
MKRWLALTVVGLAVFVAAALWHTPMNLVHAWLAPQLAPAQVQLHGVGGHLGSGRASRVDLRGQPLMSDLQWRLQPLQLLLGRAQFRVSGGGQGSVLDGRVAMLPSGTLILGDTRYTAPVAQLAALAGQGNLPIQGQAGLTLDHLRLRNQWPERAKGVVTVRGLGWTLGRETVLLGDYQATVEDATAGIKALIETLGGDLQVRGEARLDPDRSYELELQLRPGADAPPLVNNLVRNLGKPDAQGWYRLRRQGSVPGGPGP